MKIGILTFHEADSYGAVLQAYALQQTLRSLGADSEFVQIQMRGNTDQAQPTAGAAAIFARRMQEASKKRAELFAQFRQQHLNCSSVYLPTDDIDSDYDCFIAGSDQIWNFRIPGADARYFLPFAKPEKRNSYAASFGADALPEKARDWAAGQLSGFQRISVREESGCRIVKELTSRNAEVCLDPTLLPDHSEWETLVGQEPSEPYILAFLLKYDAHLVEMAKAEAERQGVHLRIISAAFMPQLGMDAWNTTSVTDWLGAIRYARCVFTNSFHGMVFSMIFGRCFHVERLTGELSSRNGRLDEMLLCLQLLDAADKVVCPDYEQIWKLIEPKRNASLEYLRRIVNHDTVG